MIVPTFLYEKWVKENGELTESAEMYHDELNRSMQSALSDNGWTFPQQEFATIQDIEGEMPDGTVWWDTDNSRLVLKNGANLYSINTSIIP